jgi:hypothetical protein
MLMSFIPYRIICYFLCISPAYLLSATKSPYTLYLMEGILGKYYMLYMLSPLEIVMLMLSRIPSTTGEYQLKPAKEIMVGISHHR